MTCNICTTTDDDSSDATTADETIDIVVVVIGESARVEGRRSRSHDLNLGDSRRVGRRLGLRVAARGGNALGSNGGSARRGCRRRV